MCPKQGEGGCRGHFWTMSERKQLFSQEYFTKDDIDSEECRGSDRRKNYQTDTQRHRNLHTQPANIPVE